jgi:hypothetical protein
MAKVTREYEDMVRSMDATASFLSRARAAKGPTARQLAAHKRDLEETRRQQKGGKR